MILYLVFTKDHMLSRRCDYRFPICLLSQHLFEHLGSTKGSLTKVVLQLKRSAREKASTEMLIYSKYTIEDKATADNYNN